MVEEDAVIQAAIRCATGYLNVEHSVARLEISTPKANFVRYLFPRDVSTKNM